MLGFTKQWWTNRSMKKLELLDAEKRARRSDVQRCGVDSLLINDIPFGVRAIQRGIEVDGIWISSPNTPDLSHIASSTTLIGEPTASLQCRETPSTKPRRNTSREHSTSVGSNTEEANKAHQPSTTHAGLMPPAPAFGYAKQPHARMINLPSNVDAIPHSSLSSYMPNGTKNQQAPKESRLPVLTGVSSHKPESHPVASTNLNKENLTRGGVIARKRAHRHDEQCHQTYEAKPDSDIMGVVRQPTEAADEKEGDDERQHAQSDCSHRPRRKRVSRRPPIVQSR